MPNIAAPDYRSLVYAAQRTSAPAATTPPTPPVGQRYTSPAVVQEHATGSDCGCGASHGGGGASPSTALATMDSPAFLAKPSFLQSPSGLQSLEKVGTMPTDFMAAYNKINWSEDWWKFVAGALAYRFFVSK